jgi:hypothetical protein
MVTWVLTPEQSAYISSVLDYLIAIPMVKKVKYREGAMRGFVGETYSEPVEEVVVEPKDVNHPNWPKTVKAVQYLIDWGMCEVYNFEITMNSAYTKFKKTTLKTKTK